MQMVPASVHNPFVLAYGSQCPRCKSRWCTEVYKATNVGTTLLERQEERVCWAGAAAQHGVAGSPAGQRGAAVQQQLLRCTQAAANVAGDLAL